MATVKDQKKPTSVFDALKKNNAPDQYVICSSGRIKNRHAFRYLPWSRTYNEAHGASKESIKSDLGLLSIQMAQPHLMYSDEMYREAIIGVCDDEGIVSVKSREHAKLIWLEMRSIDPKCKVHQLSLPLPLDADGNLTEPIRVADVCHSDFEPVDPDAEVSNAGNPQLRRKQQPAPPKKSA